VVEPSPGRTGPSLLVAMFTMPMSTPKNPLTGSVCGASGASTVACRNHLPSRQIRSVSPIARVRNNTRSRGAARMGMPLYLPAVVQIDTVASRAPTLSGICQDKHRASNGCAASGRNLIGVAANFFRFSDPGGP
jgi:hypothetical protein